MSSTKILIVDDEQRIRKLLRDYLIRDGYTVYEASNGRQALDIFNSGRHDAGNGWMAGMFRDPQDLKGTHHHAHSQK